MLDKFNSAACHQSCNMLVKRYHFPRSSDKLNISSLACDVNGNVWYVTRDEGTGELYPPYNIIYYMKNGHSKKFFRFLNGTYIKRLLLTITGLMLTHDMVW